MPENIQPFANLDAATEAALRASIERFGVILPIVKDQHGRILDGNQRARIAAELGVFPDEITVSVKDEDEAHEYARTLNADRRHLTPDQRREVVSTLREQGHSFRAIAGAVGVSKSQVADDVAGLSSGGQSPQPERVIRQGGGTYPAQRPKLQAVPDLKADVIDHAEPGQEPAPVSLWDALVGIAERIEALAKTEPAAIAATVPAARQVSTAKRLRRVGSKLASIAWVLERMAAPTPEEERAKRDAEEAARPAKAAHELDLAKLNLGRIVEAQAAKLGDPAAARRALEAARLRIRYAEDEVLLLARRAEDRDRRNARDAKNVTPADA